jgi:hypothetical protein
MKEKKCQETNHNEKKYQETNHKKIIQKENKKIYKMKGTGF